MYQFLDEDLQPSSSEFPKLLQLSLQSAQLSHPVLTFSGRLLSEEATLDDCRLELFARDKDGNPSPEWHLGIEIYRAGEQLSLTVERLQCPEYPILWQGQHPVWMDAETGGKVDRPREGELLERLGRRLMTKLRAID